MRQFIRVIKTPVTLIALLAILGFGAKWGFEQINVSDGKVVNNACVMTDVGKELTPAKVTVRVYNGGNTPKMASLTKLFLNSHDFRVVKTNNSERRVATTVIVGNSANDPEVKLLQQFFVDAVAEGRGAMRDREAELRRTYDPTTRGSSHRLGAPAPATASRPSSTTWTDRPSRRH